MLRHSSSGFSKDSIHTPFMVLSTLRLADRGLVVFTVACPTWWRGHRAITATRGGLAMRCCSRISVWLVRRQGCVHEPMYIGAHQVSCMVRGCVGCRWSVRRHRWRLWRSHYGWNYAKLGMTGSTKEAYLRRSTRRSPAIHVIRRSELHLYFNAGCTHLLLCR